MSKYTRQITQTLTDEDQGFTINVDVYDVLRAFNVTDPAIQHAIKKLLCTGIRGHKDTRQDLEEAVQSIERALDVVKVEESLAAFADELQPVTSDNPQESPACPWRFGDVIRTRGEGTDFDWTITEITPRGIECRTGGRGEISTFIPFASYKDYDLVKEVEADDAPACPFKVGDIIAKPNSTGWKIDRILSDRLHVTSDDPYQTPSQIDRQFWGNYSIVVPTTLDQNQQTC